jgi:DNA-binding MurR/RpiR family transcriptional regulator
MRGNDGKMDGGGGEVIEAPRGFDALRELILSRHGQLPKRLAQVAAYALDNPDEIALGTVASIANNSGVQPSALVRFSQAMGYQGFSEFQEVFQSRLRERVLTYEERLARMREHGMAASKSSLVLDGFLEAAERSVATIRGKLDHLALERAADLLAEAETVYLIGLRRSFPITAYMSYAMGKLGIRHVLVDALAGLGAEQSSFVTSRDAVIAISFTPYASETAALTNAARSREAKIISVTDSIFSPIAPPADVLLEVAEANFEGFRSMAATMALAMALTVAAAGRRREG